MYKVAMKNNKNSNVYNQISERLSNASKSSNLKIR